MIIERLMSRLSQRILKKIARSRLMIGMYAMRDKVKTETKLILIGSILLASRIRMARYILAVLESSRKTRGRCQWIKNWLVVKNSRPWSLNSSIKVTHSKSLVSFVERKANRQSHSGHTTVPISTNSSHSGQICFIQNDQKIIGC